MRRYAGFVTSIAAFVVVAMFTISHAQQAPTTQGSGGLTGTWKWQNEGMGGQQDVVLKIKQDGGKITGTITGFGDQENQIQEAKFANGQLTFKTVLEFGPRPFVTNYTLDISGNTIKGKSQTVIEQEISGKKGD